MSLIKPKEVSEWNILGENVSLYSEVSPSIIKFDTFFKDDSEKWNSLESIYGDTLVTVYKNTNERDSLSISRKFMASLVPYQQDFVKKGHYTYSMLEQALYVKNLPGTKVSTYEKMCRAGITLSLIYFVNDEYEGGEIYFPDIDLTISPKKNQLLIYPSNLIKYEVKEILSGEQYLFCLFLD